MIKVTFESPWKVICNDPFSNEFYVDSIYNWSEEFDNLKEYFDDYIKEDIPIIINNMNVDNLNVKNLNFELLDNGKLLSIVEYTTDKVTEDILNETMDVLTGQFSDGMGESLEQEEAVDVVFEDEVEDDENGGSYIEQETGSLSIKLWNIDDFYIKVKS